MLLGGEEINVVSFVHFFFNFLVHMPTSLVRIFICSIPVMCLLLEIVPVVVDNPYICDE